MARIAELTACLWLATTPLASQEAAAPATVDGPIAQAIDDYLTRCVPFGFSGSVLVVKKASLILSKGYGIADRVTGTACTPETIYDLGQMAQPLTACAVLRLEQQKKLETSDTLDVFFPGVPGEKKKITLHHLLTHTSGFPRTTPGPAAKLATREELIQTMERVPLRDPPGTQANASDASYAVLAAVIETVTKRPFEEALQELVLQPAGLTSTGFRQGTDLDAARVARAHMSSDEPLPEGSKATRFPDEPGAEERELATEGWYSWGLRGAGGILGTVPDLWRFEQALRGDELLTKESKKKLFTPELAVFAYGWQVQKGKQASIECRGGTASGFGSRCARFPGDDSYLVLLANQAAALEVVEQDVRTLLFGGKVALPPLTRSLTGEALAGLAGEYEAATAARWRVSTSGDALALEALTPPALELQAGKLSGDQKLIVKQSAKIVAELATGDFGTVHGLDRDSDRFRGVEGWWRDLVGRNGSLRSSTLLGLIQDASELNHAVARLEFERGEEILDLTWGDEYLLGLGTGPPFASRLRLVPDGEASFVGYDLRRRKTMGAARFTGGGTLELDLPGGKVVAKR
jgi:CubicO group peptidase (beta-lactamase class C family)